MTNPIVFVRVETGEGFQQILTAPYWPTLEEGDLVLFEGEMFKVLETVIVYHYDDKTSFFVNAIKEIWGGDKTFAGIEAKVSFEKMEYEEESNDTKRNDS